MPWPEHGLRGPKAMSLLNKDIPYGDIATEQSREVFLPESTPSRELLHTGTRLCLFVPAPSRFAHVHHWWILFHPHLLSNHQTVPGIGEFLYHSGCRIDHNGHLIRPPGVSVCCAENKSRFLVVALTKPVYGYIGLTRRSRPEPCGGTVRLAGGEFRAWIPGISALDLQRVPTPVELCYQPPAPENAEEALAGEADAGEPENERGRPGSCADQ